jgi:hypothetical protein
MRSTFPLCLVLLAAQPFCQELRRGLTDADAVVVGRQIGKRSHSDQVDLHRVQVVLDVRGAGANTAVIVLDWPNLSLHQRPFPRQSRLYCLQDAAVTAAKLGLPAAEGPYYRMVGWAGSNPLVGADVAADPHVQFAQILARSEAGARPGDTAAALCETALRGAAGVRTEAARLLAERPDLRAQLVPAQWSGLVTRAGGEIDDVPHKIALAELCAEQRLEGLVESLVTSLGPVKDPEYARTVGRIAAFLHGEQATVRLEARLRQLRDPGDRAMTLLAIGASNTESAYEALRRLADTSGEDAAVDAALAEHRTTKARAAAARRSR